MAPKVLSSLEIGESANAPPIADTNGTVVSIRNRPASSLKGRSIQSQEILNLLDSESPTR